MPTIEDIRQMNRQKHHDETMMFKPRKQIRLPTEAYAVPGSVWHVTLGVDVREARPLGDPGRAAAVAAVISLTSEFTCAPVHLYCLMPDHAHLLLEIRDQKLVSVVKSIKMTTTLDWWRAGGKGKLWQRSFHDHGIRGPRDYDATVAYVLENPVKAELSESWEAYPFIGGEIIERADYKS